jgi:hypothetical protein
MNIQKFLIEVTFADNSRATYREKAHSRAQALSSLALALDQQGEQVVALRIVSNE